jgi:hypothetical protein
LEEEIQEGLESQDLPPQAGFWGDLRKELHKKMDRKTEPRRR